nr:phosphoethanolamine transferase [Acinetobacter sp. Marseille-Q1620]
MGLGFWDYLLTIKEFFIFFLVVIINALFLICIKQIVRKKQYIFFNISLFIFILYISTATGFLQGHMSLGIIASISQTNVNEAFEFFSQIKLKFIIFSMILMLACIHYFGFCKAEYHLKFSKKMIVLLMIFNVYNLFLVQTVRAAYLYKKEEQILLEKNDKAVDWKISSVSPKYDTQVFIIGESVHRDYLSLYGFSEKTTPFLDQIPLTLIKHYVSAAPNTVTSLTRTLALIDKNKDINIGKNVISLAKQANYNTIWISNQGFLGKNDTAISKIAIHADHQLYLKSGNYMSKNIDDDELVNLFSQQIKKYKDRKNVIFLHMMGSHPNACERLFKFPRQYSNYSESINCYLSSISKMDHFIKNIYYKLRSTQQSFTITYFSDHGMTIDEDHFYVDNDYKSNYNVPFFHLSSDMKHRQVIDKKVSAYDFLNLYAGFLGIRTPLLDSQRNLRDIPDNPDIYVFDWEKYVRYRDLKNK